jgi:hypothetical protein
MFFLTFKFFTFFFFFTNFIYAKDFNTGDKVRLGINNTYKLKLIYISSINTYPTGIDDDYVDELENNFLLSETETSYELWELIYSWAIKNGYSFLDKGLMGSHGKENRKINKKHPVTKITYIDAIIWTNALTEYYNLNNNNKREDLEFVYFTNNEPFKNPETLLDEKEFLDFSRLKIYNKNLGFRLPRKKEWELAARISFDEKSNTVLAYKDPYFISGNSPSGSSDSYENEKQNKKVAWYNRNSTKKVGKLGFLFFNKNYYKNDLGLYDMSGNVWEMLSYDSSVYIKGGAWNTDSDDIVVANELEISPFCNMLILRNNEFDIGFRIAKTF